MRRVEVRQAFEFTCEACGRDVLAYCIAVPYELVERAEAQDENGPCSVLALCPPDTVRCPHCDIEYEAKYPEFDDEDDLA